VATATLAAIAGGGGLGEIIVDQASYKLSGVLAASMWVAALALLVDVGLGAVQRLLTPRGLRREAPVVGPSDTGTRPGARLEPAPGAASQ
jgi:ABC-type proline/glycine betaine transport system permease subunit